MGKVSFRKEHRQETIIYIALWTLLFMAPVLSLAIRTANTGIAFDWSEITTVWKQFALFFVVFLIHNHLLAPMLIYQQRKIAYFSLALAIMVIFQVYQCNHRPTIRGGEPLHEMRGDNNNRPPLPPRDFRDGPPGRMGENMKPGPMDEPMKHGPMDETIKPGPKDEHPPVIVGQHDIITLVILVLMLGMNLGVKLYFKQRSDQKQLAELERQNLEQQLEYLKYQINPHFLMNTLNNIHALVDIDPENAKQTILELSKMMRFVLYEGSKTSVPLDKEIAFLQNYITLMKLRYTDKVLITVEVPGSLPGKEVPPLIFITFVENAFKHGVTYRQASFIDIRISIEDAKLTFTCANSRIPKDEDKHGGIGLTNVKQRLDLIYGQRYSLNIQDEPDTYTVTLTIPL